MSSPETETPPPAIIIQPPSPRFPLPLTTTSPRKVAIAVDLSDESAHAVHWALHNYLRPDDSVILLHVRPTSVLYGADWGPPSPHSPSSHHQLEQDFDNFTTTKANDLAKPLLDAGINYKIHIVKDHDLKERLCLEVERLGLSAVIMGSRGFGAVRRSGKGGRLGSVSDYCVNHCVCPVVVVRLPEGKDGESGVNGGGEGVLCPVPEEEAEFHDASDKQSGSDL